MRRRLRPIGLIELQTGAALVVIFVGVLVPALRQLVHSLCR
jgi:hypothetical protein